MWRLVADLMNDLGMLLAISLLSNFKSKDGILESSWIPRNGFMDAHNHGVGSSKHA